MFQNYLKIAWRNLRKHRMYAAIKIGGFACSIAACILITLYIIHEVSYDKSYPDGERIYRIIARFNNNGKILKGTSFQAPLSKAIKADFPQVEMAGRILPNSLFYGAGSNQVNISDNPTSIYEEGFTYMDQELLDMLQLPMAFGKRSEALAAPYTLVMTKSKAEKYFPGKNPIGKIVYLNGDRSKPYTIKGVIEDLPSTSHLKPFTFLLTLNGVVFYPGEQDNWGATNYPTYIKLRKGTDVAQFEKMLTKEILSKYVIPNMQQAGNVRANEMEKNLRLSLQPVKNIHLYSADIQDYPQMQRGDIKFVWLFGGIATFILLIACINFINLSTAKSAKRAKEVGLRKVVGSYRSSLITQFLAESTLYSILSFLIGLLLAWLLLPLFNALSGKELGLPWSSWQLLPIILCSALFVGLLAGLYPSFYLSGFRPIAVLKGELSHGTRNPFLRNGLVVFQFVTSIMLIIGTLIINNQMNFILNKKIGFDKDQVMILQGTSTLGNQLKVLKEELQKLPQVKSASVSDFLPVRMEGVKRNGNTFWKEGKTTEEAGTGGQFWEIDENYLSTLGMKLRAGRNFSKDMATDSQSVIINQKLANDLGLKNPIGARITNGRVFTVIGVLEDFNFESLKDEVDGLCMALSNSPTMLAVKINGKDVSTAVQAIGLVWKKFSPDQAMRYTFLDEGYANMYSDVRRTGNIFTSFASLAIFIACLGLFGLAAFTTEQRTKEIGIRKVLGASVRGILQLLTKDFLRLVFVAIVIASPLAWWAMNKWLQDFAYRIEIQWWVFAIAGLAAIVIAILTVSFQAIKAALANPTKSLRSE
ncbi:ABC transporter permease [Olivibacter sp. CPCC 100613]|uniref:ABC transporter permease n=1 Tax=Olivibacter sp. CPCC 100613 TaxID=3079931 RepID=UPI002FFB8D44